MEARLVPNEYGLKWLKFSWKIVKNNYPQYIALTFAILIGSVLTYILPYVGIIASGFLTPLISAAICLFTKDSIESEKADLNKAFDLFKNEKLIERLLPYCLLHVAYGLISFFIGKLSSSSPFIGMFLTLSLSLIYICFTWLLAPILLFTNIKLIQGMILTQQAITKNLTTFLLHGIWGLVVLFASAIPTCGIGILFIYLPISFASQYVSFASIFTEDPLKSVEDSQLKLF